MEGQPHNSILSDQEKSELQARLLAWYRVNGRDFPWRHTSNPYEILVAEKLLQQTAAHEIVVRAFRLFTTKYPSPEALANAEIGDLEAVIAPLGLHYRAKEIKALACALVQHYDGSIPREMRLLMGLPGIGDYTARAILSFAYGQDVPIVDTNVARFLYRVFALPGPFPSNPARKKGLLDLAAGLLPFGRSRDFNLAILDLCALICTAAEPQCGVCPIQPFCHYGRAALNRPPGGVAGRPASSS
jgi:A/G-specific adenine glycosylase